MVRDLVLTCHNGLQSFADDLSVVCDTGGGDNIIFEVEREFASDEDQLHEVDNIFTEHHTGVFGRAAGQIGVTDDTNSAFGADGFAIFGNFAVATG